MSNDQKDPEYRPVLPTENVLKGDQFHLCEDRWQEASHLDKPPAIGMHYRRKVEEAAPLSVTVEHTFLKEILDLLDIAIENTSEVRQTHEQSLGRTTRKNKQLGEMYDTDLARLQIAEARLKEIVE